jgi:hypothetical protein
VSLRTSPVVESHTTAWYCARLAVVNWFASSVAVTEKPFCDPSVVIAAMPSSIDEWRKPAVFENTRILDSGAASAGGGAASGATTTAMAEVATRRALATVRTTRSSLGAGVDPKETAGCFTSS